MKHGPDYKRLQRLAEHALANHCDLIYHLKEVVAMALKNGVPAWDSTLVQAQRVIERAENIK